MSQNGIKLLCHLGYVPVLSFSNFEFCENYLYGKQTKLAHKRQEKKDLEKLDLVHLDVCGPMLTPSLGRAEYCVTFIDDATSKVWAYAIAQKSNFFHGWLWLRIN